MFATLTDGEVLMFDMDGRRIFPCECVDHGLQEDGTYGFDGPFGPDVSPLGDDCIAYGAGTRSIARTRL